ncbi:XdhC family protein [Hyphomicrobium sp.]|uniref:XdhC family protein n=1 Tax=Hyphomicrobium sp. TaxID=82 RepID=UPI0025C50A61|nr:XdhC family protein [Hyphomicrobium sp.]MCC7252284.1 XdhC family protein [Hyphomicrobium sp.]
MPEAGAIDVGGASASVDSGPSRDVTAIARQWLDQYGTISLATVIKTWGSSPVPVGGQLVVGPDERFEGSVSGGCVEAAVITAAGEVMASGQPKVLEFGVGDETAWRVGLPCGGRIEIFVERLSGAGDATYLDAVLAARALRSLLVVDTDLASGRRTLHRDTGAFPADTADALTNGECVLVEDDEGRCFLHALAPPLRVILVGAGHVAQVLADLAQRVGFQATVIDPRTAFSSEVRFGGVPLRQDWPEAALPALGLDNRTAVITLAHDARLDDETLPFAVRSPCFYVGALGSRRTHEKRVERLAKAGLSEAEIARIDAPVGLPIGAKGPGEIAVSILGAVIKARRGA